MMTTEYSQASMCIQEAVFRHLRLHGDVWPAVLYVSAAAFRMLEQGGCPGTGKYCMDRFMGIPMVVVKQKKIAGIWAATIDPLP